MMTMHDEEGMAMLIARAAERVEAGDEAFERVVGIISDQRVAQAVKLMSLSLNEDMANVAICLMIYSADVIRRRAKELKEKRSPA